MNLSIKELEAEIRRLESSIDDISSGIERLHNLIRTRRGDPGPIYYGITQLELLKNSLRQELMQLKLKLTAQEHKENQKMTTAQETKGLKYNYGEQELPLVSIDVPATEGFSINVSKNPLFPQATLRVKLGGGVVKYIYIYESNVELFISALREIVTRGVLK